MDDQELYEFFNDRMSAYQFLARMYKTAPDAELIDSLLALDADTETPLKAAIEAMRGCDREQLRIDLAAEYNRVFLGMGPRPIAPYESVYTSPERLLMQDARDEVLALYRAEALTLADGIRIPEDHVAIEFDFMSYLCKKAAQACIEKDQPGIDEYTARQKDFLIKHLLVWVPAMCKDMESRVSTEFYKCVCDATLQQLEIDREWVSGD